MSGEWPFNSTTSNLMTILSGSPSPSRSSDNVTASAASCVDIKVSIETPFVPLTKAAMSAGLSGLHSFDSCMVTPSITCALRHAGSVNSEQTSSTGPSSTLADAGKSVAASTHECIRSSAAPPVMVISFLCILRTYEKHMIAKRNTVNRR